MLSNQFHLGTLSALLPETAFAEFLRDIREMPSQLLWRDKAAHIDYVFEGRLFHQIFSVRWDPSNQIVSYRKYSTRSQKSNVARHLKYTTVFDSDEFFQALQLALKEGQQEPSSPQGLLAMVEKVFRKAPL